MAWGPFSAEAVILDSKVRLLHKDGRVTDAIALIEDALRKAQTEGSCNMSFGDFEQAALITLAERVEEALATQPAGNSAP